MPAEMTCRSFLTWYTMSRNYVFKYILTINYKKNPLRHPPPPRWVLLLFQTTWRLIELPMYCGLQFSAMPVSIPVNFWSRAKQSARAIKSSVVSTLMLFPSGPMTVCYSGLIPKTVVLYSTPSKQPGEVNWSCGVKTDGPHWYLTVLPESSLIMVKNKESIINFLKV